MAQNSKQSWCAMVD